VDRLKVRPGIEDRLADAIGTCFAEGEGECIVVVGTDGRDPTRLSFTEHFRCPEHPEVEFLEPSPKLFSFNNPYGSCPRCTGFGATLEYDPDLIIPNPRRSIDDGAVDPWTKPRYHKERDLLRAFTLDRGVSLYTSWEDLPEDFRDTVLHGGEGFKGVIPFLVSREKKRYKQYIRVFLRQYQSPSVCPECGGARVRPEALWVRIGGWTVAQASEIPLEDLQEWVAGLRLSPMETRIAETIVRELHARLAFL
ncbi:MAG: excinuclease ABC subunit A, partial [Gemmatimonadetes bacterium]|nr:excinuclease ABC subunit A [Gemmatimonadota bacterium]NIW67178.1 excinuclease ABC subunit A [Gemmatimonadota bacterium]